ncbi:MAG TPA: glycosyltransferase family 2 protein [Gemmatimonadaceae bacterium]|nr:glycosyltransferase family 2 protein [Gemmatimonadaceae bacterium]
MTANVACVIPAYNAAKTLPSVIGALRRALPAAAVVGVDDGSSDGSLSVLATLADRALRLPTNRGKGAALRAGIAEARTLGATAVVTVDADGQHDASLAPRLLAALASADLVVGTRVRGGDMPLARRVTNYLSSAAVRAIVGTSVPDTQSGFRAIRMELLDRVGAAGDRYEWETDLLLRAARGGWRIVAVPVPTVYGPPSHFRLLRDAARVVHTLWRHAAGTTT